MSFLAISQVTAGYGRGTVLHGISLEVGSGKFAVILGANGAGKTTTLRAISGLVRASGSIVFAGRDLTALSPHERARAGIAHVPQGRGTFGPLSVLDNLRVGAATRRDKPAIDDDVERWLQFFPRLRQRLSTPAAMLSGGEQQMVAVARAMMSRPQLLLLDEPSLGLAPLIVTDLLAALARLNKEDGIAILLVEQNARAALAVADQAFVLEVGRIALAGSAADIMADASIEQAYLGV